MYLLAALFHYGREQSYIRKQAFMKSTEKHITQESNYYIYSPSIQAINTFLYPLFVGYFYYEKGYTIQRDSYDSFLIMHIKKGKCGLIINSNTYVAEKNQIIFINCYQLHKYYAITDLEIEWLHFDGPTAAAYFQFITSPANYVLTLKDCFLFSKKLHKIFTLFHESQTIKEPLISQYITEILTEMILSQEVTVQNPMLPNVIEESIQYINENLSQTITLEMLAQRASLSPYYFTRVFKKETGFTPYQYILSARINYAKFLLKNTQIPIAEICFHTGFSNESSFCTAFKKWVHMTPRNYRFNESS